VVVEEVERFLCSHCHPFETVRSSRKIGVGHFADWLAWWPLFCEVHAEAEAPSHECDQIHTLCPIHVYQSS
jgi:hypothetical protein